MTFYAVYRRYFRPYRAIRTGRGSQVHPLAHHFLRDPGGILRPTAGAALAANQAVTPVSPRKFMQKSNRFDPNHALGSKAR
ncbi:MAG: hypothetical protein V4724_31185 [Pseudomonadota bacterium]